MEKLSQKKSSKDRLEIYYELALKYNEIQSDSVKYFADLILKESSPYDTINKIRANYENFRYYLDKRDYIKSDSLNKIVYKLSSKISDKQWQFKCDITIAASLITRGKLDSALVHFDRAKYFLPNVEKLFKADYFQYKGLYHDFRGEYDKTIENYLIALDYYKQLKANRAIANIYNNTAIIYVLTDDYDSAITNFEKALEINQKINNYSLIVQNFLNLGLTNLRLNKYDKSINYLNKGLEVVNRGNAIEQKYDLYTAFGSVYGLKKQRDSAIYYNSLGLQGHLEKNNYDGYVSSAMNIAQDYLSQKDFKSSSFYIEKARQTIVKNNLVNRNLDLYRLQSSLDSTRGNYKDALKYYKLSEGIEDSLMKIQNTYRLQELQTKFETLEKEQEIDFLKIKNQNAELELTKNRYQNYGLILVLFLLLTLALSLYNRFTVKNRLSKELRINNTKLVTKSSQLEISLKEREVLIREIHHRVKNNLQLVISMLNLQGQNTQGVDINEFLSRSQDRIASMALVHEALYVIDSPGLIDFKNYLEELILGIYNSFDFKDKAIDYQINCNSFFIDIDTSVTLGIIVNELVYNVFKHAFTSKSKGTLKLIVKDKNGIMKLNIIDDGDGIDKREIKVNSKSIGLKLVELLTSQLKGNLTVNSSHSGTNVEISINKTTK